jgi:hypothetical protein
VISVGTQGCVRLVKPEVMVIVLPMINGFAASTDAATQHRAQQNGRRGVRSVRT